MAEEPPPTKSKVGRSSRLPQVGIERTLTVARTLHELAGPATPHRIAQRLGVSPSAGAFKTLLGSAGYYGLIRQEGDRRVLTELGERAIEDGDAGMAARREAVAQTGYRNVLTALRGREANEGVIVARLQDDFGLASPAASQIAKALIEAGEQTSLIVGGRFDAASIEDAIAQVPAADPGGSGRSAVRQPRLQSRDAAGMTGNGGRSIPAPSAPVVGHQPSRSAQPALHIDIQLHIPATATAEQIDQIFASMAKHLYGRE